MGHLNTHRDQPMQSSHTGREHNFTTICVIKSSMIAPTVNAGKMPYRHPFLTFIYIQKSSRQISQYFTAFPLPPPPRADFRS